MNIVVRDGGDINDLEIKDENYNDSYDDRRIW